MWFCSFYPAYVPFHSNDIMTMAVNRLIDNNTPSPFPAIESHNSWIKIGSQKWRKIRNQDFSIRYTNNTKTALNWIVIFLRESFFFYLIILIWIFNPFFALCAFVKSLHRLQLDNFATKWTPCFSLMCEVNIRPSLNLRRCINNCDRLS